MDRRISRVSVALVGVFVFALLSPKLVEAEDCECTSYPQCSGNFCYCCLSGSNYCFEQEPITNPCHSSLSYNASPDELAAFKERIDSWSEREDLRPVVEAATELYNSVLFKDSQSFVEATDKFKQAVNSLSEDARKGLIQSERRQGRRQ